MSERICSQCGKPESEHHEFAYVKLPDGCVCDPGTWWPMKDVTPVCGEYEGDGISYCNKCEHDKACHKNYEKMNEQETK